MRILWPWKTVQHYNISQITSTISHTPEPGTQTMALKFVYLPTNYNVKRISASKNNLSSLMTGLWGSSRRNKRTGNPLRLNNMASVSVLQIFCQMLSVCMCVRCWADMCWQSGSLHQSPASLSDRRLTDWWGACSKVENESRGEGI